MKALLPFVLASSMFAAGCSVSPVVTQGIAFPFSPPSLSLASRRWHWPAQGAPSPELEQLATQLDSPRAISNWLARNVAWRDDYDTGIFLTPDTVVAERRAVCTGFARFWVWTLAQQGIKAHFVAFWSNDSAHAVAVFRDRDGRYRMASNAKFYPAIDLDPGNRGIEAAQIAAAMEFFGPGGWNKIQVFNGQGAIIQEIVNTRVPAASLAAPPDGRNVFSNRN